FFASCTYACPILVNDMKRIETALINEDEISSYKFLLVSIDPERDTPEMLSEFAKRHKLDLKRWKLLTGTADDIMELAAVTGFKYKKEDNGEFSHSNMINFLNDGGEIIHQQIGLNQDITPSTEKILSMK
ncbi:MAG: SCO family protein, partial [Ignavibacteriales bacterium]